MNDTNTSSDTDTKSPTTMLANGKPGDNQEPATTNLLNKITAPTPIWVCWGVNGLAWTMFILTGNHVLEFMMGLACLYVACVAIAKRNEKGAQRLIFVSLGDAIWMFYWAFARPMDGISSAFESLSHLTQ